MKHEALMVGSCEVLSRSAFRFRAGERVRIVATGELADVLMVQMFAHDNPRPYVVATDPEHVEQQVLAESALRGVGAQ